MLLLGATINNLVAPYIGTGAPLRWRIFVLVATAGRLEGEKVHVKDSNEYHPVNILTEKKN